MVLITLAPTAFMMLGWLFFMEGWNKSHPNRKAEIDYTFERLPRIIGIPVSVAAILCAVAVPFMVMPLAMAFHGLFWG